MKKEELQHKRRNTEKVWAAHKAACSQTPTCVDHGTLRVHCVCIACTVSPLIKNMFDAIDCVTLYQDFITQTTFMKWKYLAC